MIDIVPISAFHDNYIWAMIHPQNRQCVIVDPGDAEPVTSFLQKNALKLTAILITHHHSDHTGGVRALVANHKCAVFGPSSITGDCQVVVDGDKVALFDDEITLKVMETPGHTLDHIVYYGHDWLFCGDTLFSAGCGRLFEGTAEQMWESLQKLMALPDNTALFCAHEYTLNNLQFAQTLEPENTDIQKAIFESKPEICTLPSTIGREKHINPYFRTHKLAFTPKEQFKSNFHAFKKARALKNDWNPK